MKKIAIVDDEHLILETIKKFLSRRGIFEIDTFDNPLNAISPIKSGKYDLVLCDIMMPQMNGIDLLKEVKKTNPNQKFIMITAYSTEERIICCDELQVDDYITKPFISLRDIENKILDKLNL